ncbi:LysE family transporter [Mycolicibacterium palauense]|uniref:LysE family transporter n=1 Tax=Mycolicibacterium palauense TaxID=2034511 RepID=UPI000BFEFF24|nr:LysE family transporter [Mycolicibacterium palauense]
MEPQLWLAFLGAAIAISVSPGAGAILSMATGLSHGLRRSYWAIVGLEIGLMTQLLLVAVGLGAVVASSALAFTIIKWLGVCYLVYLAVQQWRNGAIDLRARMHGAQPAGGWSMLVRGTLVNVSNPKGLVFLLAVLPQFVVPAAPLLPQYLAIGATMVVVDLVVMGAYAGLAARLLGWLRTPRQQTLLSRTFSGLFAGAAVILSLVRRGAAV